MGPEEFRCPSCRAPQNPATPGAEVRCVFCKTVYRVPEPPPPPSTHATHATPARAGASGSSSLRGAIVMVAGLSVVATGAAVAVLFRAGPESTPPSPIADTTVSMPVSGASAPLPVTEVAAPAEAPPSLELVHVIEGNTSIGGRFYLVDVENTGTSAIGQPAVVASGFDAGGRRLLEQNGYARRSSLEPGETTTLLVLIADPPAGLTRVDVRPHLSASGFRMRERAAELVDSTERGTFGSMREIVGTVRNGTDSQLAFIQIVAVGRNAAGEPVSYADSFATNHTLAAGDSSGFTVSVGTFETSRPATWQLVAFGR